MEIQDPKPESKPKMDPSENVAAPVAATSASSASAFIRRDGSHRRAHSEATLCLPVHMAMAMMEVADPVGSGLSNASMEETGGSEDDLFSTYIDVDKLTEGDEDVQTTATTKTTSFKGRHSKHWHSNSVDGFGEIMDAKKAMPPNKLAELWTADPKRAKRILANRQSAARSKERKARYILELERKVQKLQTDATTLFAQLNLFQRDATSLSAENTELEHRLQAMEQQAQFCDAMNEALNKEVERLRIATGETLSSFESFNLGMNLMGYSQSSFFSAAQQPAAPASHPSMLLQPSSQSQSTIVAEPHQHNKTNSHPVADNLQDYSLGRLQELDISSKGSSFVKSEGPSLSASESSSTF